jgi:hypothetical protein
MAGRESKYQGLVDLGLNLAQDDEQERDSPHLKLTPRRQEMVEAWSTDPWTFLTAKDEDGTPIVRTFDQRDRKNPLKPFPSHLDYVHYLLELLESEQYMCIEKCSQMFVTTTIALWLLWRTLFRFGHKALLSKHKEEEAKTILSEKMYDPWHHMPDWCRKHLPLRNKPANRIEAPDQKSYVLGLPENAAAADARGQTYQVGLIDEAEFQEMLQPLLTAMFPRAGQVFWWSTPERGGLGVSVFRGYLKDDPIKFHPGLIAMKRKYAHVQGMTTRRNEEKGVTIARIEYRADPAKNSQRWLDEARRPYVSDADFRREILIDRTSNAGKLFHPQFAETPRRFCVRCDRVPKGVPIIRGWDFGGARPACVWGFWHKGSRRFWALRELLGVDIDTYQFRDLVRYLSGQVSLESIKHHTRAMQMIEELRSRPGHGYPPMPWFEGAHTFYDFAGHEGRMGPRGLVRSGEAKAADEILALGGINLYSNYVLHSQRTEVINGLSRLREDGHPGLLIDPSCIDLWDGLVGQIVYAKPTPSKPDPNEPAEDNTYSHLYDAFGYALVSMAQLSDADVLRGTLGPDGQIVLPIPEDSQVLSYLTRGH